LHMVWLTSPEPATAQPPGGPAVSTCKRVGAASSAVTSSRVRALPIPRKSSKPRVSLPLNSTGEPNRGSGDARLKIIAAIAASFVTAFKELSTKYARMSNYGESQVFGFLLSVLLSAGRGGGMAWTWSEE